MRFKTIQLNDRTVRYFHYPAEDKPVFLFLHGYGSLPEFHTPFLEQMAEHYEVIGPHLYGAAYLKPPVESLEEYEQLTFDFYDHLLRNEKRDIYIGGHSYGATLAVILAHNNANVQKVAASAPVFFASSLQDNLWHTLYHLTCDIMNPHGEVRNLAFHPSIAVQYTINAIPLWHRHVLLAPGMTRLDLQNFPCLQPVMLIYPDHDSFFKLPAEYASLLKKKIPNLEVKHLHKYSHNWILYYQSEAAGYFRRFFES